MAKKKYYSTAKSYYNRKHIFPVFQFFYYILKWFYPKHEIIYECEKPNEPVVFCSNHQRTYGPIAMMAKFGKKTRPWTIHTLCFYKTAPEFMQSDIFPSKTKTGKFWSKLVSVLLTPLAVSLFRGVQSIPTYYDNRMSITFRKSIQTLKENISITIFPEPSMHYLEYHKHFSIGFVNIARQYYKETKKCLEFYPVYCCKKKRIIVVGEPVKYDPMAEFNSERERIGKYILNMMSDMALYHEENRVCGYYNPTISKKYS